MEAITRISTPGCWLRSTDFPTTSRTNNSTAAVRFRLRSSLNGSASSSSSSHDDGSDSDLPPPPPDTASPNGGKERYQSANDGLPLTPTPTPTPTFLPAKEVLHRLRREAQLKSIIEELKYNSAMKPPPSQQQPFAELEMQEREVRVPSWAVTAVTMAVAFAAGVALAQFRGGLFSRNKPAIVESRVAPYGTVSVSYPEQLLGHFRAEEAPASDVKDVLADGSVKLRTAAADAFLRMQDAARAEGIWLIPLSGFRSIKIQHETFFDVKAERNQSATECAKVSAPPGYSEHHTGYALDIGDALNPAADFQQGFEEVAAYSWLQQNAARFHFELSFPKDNVQGIMYEPWHWRFVGDDHSLHTFYTQHQFSISSCKP